MNLAAIITSANGYESDKSSDLRTRNANRHFGVSKIGTLKAKVRVWVGVNRILIIIIQILPSSKPRRSDDKSS